MKRIRREGEREMKIVGVYDKGDEEGERERKRVGGGGGWGGV